MTSNSRTKLRLELMREQSLNAQQQKMQHQRSSSSSSNPSSTPPLPNAPQLSSNSNFGAKSQPIIINQPIRFAGNRLVHLPPQIIHVQTGQRESSKVLMSSSLPPGFGLQPAGMFSPTEPRTNAPTGGRQHFFYNQRDGSPMTQMRTASQASPAELSPDLGPIDSPRSTSFTSAQSELDEIIIDEILSLEDDRLKQNETEETSPSRLTLARQISNSAPTSLVDIESLVHQELVREQENLRDRRKKDIHNMIERRRRYNINDRIKELGTLLPKSCTDSIPRDVKLNKGTILKASVDYIRSLQRVTEKIHGFDDRQMAIDAENRRMSHRIQELEQLLISNGLPVPPSPPAPAVSSHRSSSSTATLTSGSSSATLQGLIKQEPPDDDLFGHTGYSPQSDVSSGGSLGGTSFYYGGGDCASPVPQSNQPQSQGQPQQQQQQQYYTSMTPVRQQLSQSNSTGGQMPTPIANSYAQQQQYSGQSDCREPLTVFMGQNSPGGGDVRMQTSSPIQLKSPVTNPSGSYGPRSLPSPYSSMSPTTGMKRHTVGVGSHIQNMGPLPMPKGLPSRATSSSYLVSPGGQNCQQLQQRQLQQAQPQQQQSHPSLCNFNSFGSQGSPSNGQSEYGEFLLSDPLISASVNSPEVHWDSGSFSPTTLAPQEVMEQN